MDGTARFVLMEKLGRVTVLLAAKRNRSPSANVARRLKLGSMSVVSLRAVVGVKEI